MSKWFDGLASQVRLKKLGQFDLAQGVKINQIKSLNS